MTGNYIRHLETENDRMRTHCAIAAHQIMSMKLQMNTRAAKKKWPGEAQR
jgi:hypothetical protein